MQSNRQFLRPLGRCGSTGFQSAPLLAEREFGHGNENQERSKTLARAETNAASSSCSPPLGSIGFAMAMPGWRNGIRGGLKIPCPLQDVWVRPPLRALSIQQVSAGWSFRSGLNFGHFC